MEWSYDWLYSCPAVLVLGYYRLYDFKGVVTLPLMYPRAIVLGRDGEVREYNRIPPYMFGDKIREICRGIACGEKIVDDFLEKALLTTVYYGGYNLILDYKGEAIPVSLELVDTTRYFFYYRRLENAKPVTRDIKTWITFGVGLRTGNVDLLFKACHDIGSIDNGKCFIETHNGLLLITTKQVEDKEYTRIVPDNNPLRHVINYDRVKRG